MFAPRLSAPTIGFATLALPALLAAQPADNTVAAPAPATQVQPSADSGWTQTQEPAAAVAPTSTPISQVPSPAPIPVQPVASEAPPPVIAAPPPPPAPVSPPPSDDPPTLFNGHALKVGGYGGIGVRYARLRGDNGVLTGVEGALLLDHRLAIGVAGYSWATQQQVGPAASFESPYLHYGFGGLLVRYHVYVPNSPVYVSAAALVGGGAIGLTRSWDGDVYRENADIFFVCEPQLGVHVNFTRWMRAGLDAGYRIHSGVGRFGYTESDFNGISLGGNLQFGWF
jgi:hypothetical protein